MVFIGKYRTVLQKPWPKLNVYFNKKTDFRLYNV